MLRRRDVLALSLLPFAPSGLACSKGQAADGALALALDWFPEPEHGGFYAAQVAGDYAAAGLAVEILAGRPDAPVIAQVAAGRVAFGISDASAILAARAQQVPIVAVFAAMQQNPRCILVHADGPGSLAELRDTTLAMNVREPFSQFLQQKLGLPGVSVVPYAGNVAPFLADPNFAQQAYVFSEPIVVERQGVAARCLLVADLGFDPYAGVVITSERMITEQPERVRSFVAAVTTGWERYLRDPAPAHAEIHAQNPEMTLETLTRSAAALAPLVAVDGGGRPGTMNTARWLTLHQQLSELGVYPAAAVDPTQAFTTAFLPA